MELQPKLWKSKHPYGWRMDFDMELFGNVFVKDDENVINDDKEGLIIAPNKWFQVKALQNYSPVLSHWLRL